ncbi:MAG: phosphate acyltransferase PlsX [Planctomycetota bacterium]
MRLALDAMGGDEAPHAMVAGALDYARDHRDHTVVLVGREDAIEPLLPSTAPDNITIHHASEVITMGDKISALKDKPDDSINTASRLVKNGDADAMVLCGNTACSVAAAQLHLRRIPGVKRAGILTPLPNPKGMTWVIDCGANAVGKPEHLAQFAEMADVFLRRYSEIKEPRIGVLSIGSEEGKGDDLTQETVDLLRQGSLNCLGNVEGNDIYTGEVDIVVCDGFTGNVVLKTSEGVAKVMSTILKEALTRNALRKVGYQLAKGAFRELRERTHWSLVGGCLLLGVDGATIIGHGRSGPVAVYNALKQAARCVETEMIRHLRAHYSPAVTTRGDNNVAAAS